MSKQGLTILTILLLVFIGCQPTTTGPTGAESAVSTANYLVVQETAAADATRAAATATAQIQVTETAAIVAASTRAAIETQESIQAVGTLTTLDITRQWADVMAERERIENLAIEEVKEIENSDFEKQLENGRKAAEEDLRRRKLFNDSLPYLIGLLIFVVVSLVGVGVWIIHRRLNPKVITGPAPVYDITPVDDNAGIDIGQLLRALQGVEMPILVTDGISGIFEARRPARQTNGNGRNQAEELTAPAPARPLINSAPFELSHTMIAGETRAGKGTLARFLLANLKNRHDLTVYAVDPHYEAGNWGQIDQVIGGGRLFHEEIKPFFNDFMLPELDRRAKARAVDHAAPLDNVLVIVDELPAIKSALGKASAAAWKQWAREGWKYGLYLMCLTQSTQVESIGLKGEKDVLRNFLWRFALGAVALEEFPGKADHMDRPALMLTKRGPQPVQFPEMPRDRNIVVNTPDINGRITSAPMATAPIPKDNQAPDRHGLQTDHGFVSGPEIEHILKTRALGSSLRGIERVVWGKVKGEEGGADHYKVKEVLRVYGDPYPERATVPGANATKGRRPVIIDG